jgi:outer membrane receptor protein involved in Fe transport
MKLLKTLFYICKMNMKTLFPRIFCSLFLLVFSGLVVAQEAVSLPGQDSLPSYIMEEVVISANRYGSVQVKTPEAISVIDGKSIQKLQLRTASEALMRISGVFVQKTNHGGGSPFIRGLTGNQTLLLIDGIRLSNATVRYGPNQYFNTIDVFSLEKLEVLRGSGSVQYGSDAIGGCIQAFTHTLETTQDPLWGGNLLTRIATQGMEQSIHGNVDYSNNKGAFRAGTTWRNFGDLVGGDTTGRQVPTGYQEMDYDLKGKVELTSSSVLTLAYQSVRQSNVPVYHKVLLENYAVNKMDPQKRKLGYLKLNQKLNAGILKSALFTASFQNSEEGREKRKNGSSVLVSENDKVRSLAFSAEAYTSNMNGWSANSGLEIYNDLVHSRRTDTYLSSDLTVAKRGLYPDGATMTSIAAFTMQTLDLLDWNLSGGLRFNTYINKVNDESVGITLLTPSALVGNLAILRKLNRTSNLFFSLSRGFRAPNIDDLGTLGIVDFRYETPNYDLKPEHSFQYQIGYKYHNQDFRAEVYIYRNELYNLIARNKIPGDSIDGYAVYMKDNIGRAYIQGAETAWALELNRACIVSGSLTYTYGQNLTKSEAIRRIPPLFGRLALEYNLKKWWINIEYLTAGKQERLSAGDIDDNRIPTGGTPGWNIINMNTSYTMQFVKADLSLQNLFNQDYRYHGSGVNGYGRSAFISLQISF